MLAMLARKEIQLLRPVLIAMAIVFGLIYVVLPIGGTIWWFQWNFQPRLSDFSFGTIALRLAEVLARWIIDVTPLAWIATLLFMPILACNAFALEQRERWNELVVMLPLPAEERNRTKLGVFGGIAAGLVLLNVIISLATVVVHILLMFGAPELLRNYQLSAFAGLIGVGLLVITVAIFLLKSHTTRLLRALIIIFVCLGITSYFVRVGSNAGGVDFIWQFRWHRIWKIYTSGNMAAFLSLATGSFGLAWLLSAVTKSPTLSAAVSLGVVDGLFVLFDGMRMVVNIYRDSMFLWVVFAVIACFGLACLAAGQMIQSRNIGATEVLL